MILSINNKLVRLHGKEKHQDQVTETLTGISTVGNQYGWKVPIDAILNCKSNGLSITVDAYTTETGTGTWDSNTDFYCVKVNNSDEFVIFSGVNSFQAIDSEGHRGMTIPNSKWQDASLSNIESWKNQGEEYVVLHPPSSDINRFTEPPTCVINYYGEVEVDVKLGLANYFVPPPPEPGVLPDDMDFVYLANYFDGEKVINKAANTTFGDYLREGTITKNGSGPDCYLSNGFGDNRLYINLTNEQLLKMYPYNDGDTYTFFLRAYQNTSRSTSGIITWRTSGYIYMIRCNGGQLQIHTSGGHDLGANFLLTSNTVYKVIATNYGGTHSIYAVNLMTGDVSDSFTYSPDMNNKMSSFTGYNSGSTESDTDAIYGIAGIPRATTEAEDLAIKDVLMNQNL